MKLALLAMVGLGAGWCCTSARADFCYDDTASVRAECYQFGSEQNYDAAHECWERVQTLVKFCRDNTSDNAAQRARHDIFVACAPALKRGTRLGNTNRICQ